MAGTDESYRFPYPPLHVAGLVIAVLFVFGYSYYTLNSLKGLAPGQPLNPETGRYVLVMFGLSAFLAAFIAGALLLRGYLRFELTGSNAVLHRLRIRGDARRVEIPWDSLRAEVGADFKGGYHVWLRWPTGTQKLPLLHAVRGEGASAERLEAPSKEAEAREHPLVKALDEKLGPRLSWK